MPDADPDGPPGCLLPDPSRLDPQGADYGAILAAHRSAVAAGDGGYLDPTTGLFVMTSATLLERGTCCGSRCRHCPYVGTTAEKRA